MSQGYGGFSPKEIDAFVESVIGEPIIGMSARTVEKKLFALIDRDSDFSFTDSGRRERHADMNSPAVWALWLRSQATIGKIGDYYNPQGGQMRSDVEASALHVFETALRSYNNSKKSHETFSKWFFMSLDKKGQTLTSRAMTTLSLDPEIHSGREGNGRSRSGDVARKGAMAIISDDDTYEEVAAQDFIQMMDEIDQRILRMILEGWPLKGTQDEPGIRKVVGLSEADFKRRMEVIARKFLRQFSDSMLEDFIAEGILTQEQVDKALGAPSWEEAS